MDPICDSTDLSNWCSDVQCIILASASPQLVWHLDYLESPQPQIWFEHQTAKATGPRRPQVHLQIIGWTDDEPACEGWGKPMDTQSPWRDAMWCNHDQWQCLCRTFRPQAFSSGPVIAQWQLEQELQDLRKCVWASKLQWWWFWWIVRISRSVIRLPCRVLQEPHTYIIVNDCQTCAAHLAGAGGIARGGECDW